jgi:16S rRNA (uracil1498-N3)-methyltransferase
MKIRLYFKELISEGMALTLPKDESHYIKNVMKCQNGDAIFLFNEKCGEFEGKVIIEGKSVSVKIIKASKLPEEPANFNLFLVFSLVKNSAVSEILDKTTQIGISGFFPITTKHSVVHHFSKERAEKIIIEACEQSERISAPFIKEVASFEKFISANANETIVFCDETLEFSKENILTERLSGDVYLMIGPEGGFSESERGAISSLQNVKRISLGKNILRAETASICASFLLNYFAS